jgi:uncharacterized integral membrane protein (TIGR00697 family)
VDIGDVVVGEPPTGSPHAPRAVRCWWIAGAKVCRIAVSRAAVESSLSQVTSPVDPVSASGDSVLRDKRATLFFLLGSFLLANALVAELIGVKIFQLEPLLGLPKSDFRLLGAEHLSLQLSAGVLSWPLVFLVTDVVNDYFGVRGVRRITFVTTALIAFAFPMLFLAIATPPSEWWLHMAGNDGVPDMQAAFAAVLGQGMNIIVASLCAFVVAQLVDAVVFRSVKRITGERRIWLRATGSTLISQLVDSLLVTWIAFALLRDMPWTHATALALTAYVYKFAVAVLSTPLLYVAHSLIERWLGKELAESMRAEALAGR